MRGIYKINTKTNKTMSITVSFLIVGTVQPVDVVWKPRLRKHDAVLARDYSQLRQFLVYRCLHQTAPPVPR